MISVLLTLLKIIGIALLVLLGLLLVLLLIVLFVPLRYRIKGYYKEELVCSMKATWLLHLVTVSLNFNKELVTSFKILGIDVSKFLNNKENSETENKNKEVPSEQSKPDNSVEQKESANNNDNRDNSKEKTSEISSTANQKTDASDNKEDCESHKSQSVFSKIKQFFIGIKDKILSVYAKIREIIHNIKNKKDSVERYIRILQREEVKGAFSLCKKRIIKMIKHLLPRHMKIFLHLGMDDPSSTGYIIGIYNLLSDKLRRQITLKPEFEEVILEADFMIKGHCHAIRFLHEILCIVTDKNCRTFYKLVKKEISNERK